MGSPILTQAATIMCPHGGQAIPAPQNMTMQIMGSAVLVLTDAFPIAGCPFNISGSPAPCVLVQWTQPAVSVTVNNTPVLLQSSIGMCIGPGGGPAVVIPAQTQVLGT